MNNADLKNALLSGEPVLFNGMRYDCVSGIIYRRKKGKLCISAELADLKGNSVTIARAEKVEAFT